LIAIMMGTFIFYIAADLKARLVKRLRKL